MKTSIKESDYITSNKIINDLLIIFLKKNHFCIIAHICKYFPPYRQPSMFTIVFNFQDKNKIHMIHTYPKVPWC